MVGRIIAIFLRDSQEVPNSLVGICRRIKNVQYILKSKKSLFRGDFENWQVNCKDHVQSVHFWREQIFGDITRYQDYYKALVMNTVVSCCKDRHTGQSLWRVIQTQTWMTAFPVSFLKIMEWCKAERQHSFRKWYLNHLTT